MTLRSGQNFRNRSGQNFWNPHYHTDLAIELAYERFPRPGGNRIRATTRSTTLYLIPKLTPVFAVSEGSWCTRESTATVTRS